MEEITLTDQQQEAIRYGEGPLLIVAGAGTGKTLVLTRRIAYLIESKMAKPEEILGLTFTERAAEEMSERVDIFLPYGFANIPISTFHAFGDRILREFALELGLNPDFQVLSETEQFIFFREHLFEFPLNHYRPLSDPTKFIRAILTVISRAKDEDISPEDYMEYARTVLKTSDERSEDKQLRDEAEKQMEIAQTYVLYQKLMAEESKVDFGDQVNLVLKLFRKHPSILNRIRQRYRFILVDEFQDTNYAQFQLLQLLGGEKPNITVVGDDDQSIYKFRGAAISNILTFMEIYPDAKQIVLTENFRSTQIILDAAYRLIKNNNPERLEVKNNINKQLHAQIVEGPPVEHFHCDTLITESEHVAETISDLKENKGYSYSDIAVLVRTNSAADPFIRALNMKRIPWRFSGTRGLYSRPEIKMIISFINVITNPHDTINLYHLCCSDVYELKSMEDLNRCLDIARKQNRSLFSIFKEILDGNGPEGLTEDTLSTIPKIVKDINEYLELSRDNITGVVVYQFLTRTNYLKKLTQVETIENSIKIQNIARFFDVIWSFAQVAKEDRIVHFASHLETVIEAGDDPGAAEADSDIDAVNIMTVHKAKGLEWPVVFMVGLVHNRFPTMNRSDPIELPQQLIKEIVPSGDIHMQEERRLFYVGMTRAKERLYFTSGRDYGGVRKRKVSPFVLEALDRPGVDEVSIIASAGDKIHRFSHYVQEEKRVMRPIPKDAVLNLSYYQIDDYLICPLKYKYAHILRLPFFHHTIVYGKAVHSAVEVYYKHKINNFNVTLDDLYTAYNNAWRNIGFLSREHEERRFESGKEVIKRFFQREETSSSRPKMVEEKFSFMIEKNRVSGRWDLIEERDGKIVIADFKTSEVYDQAIADRNANKSIQLIIYAMAYDARYNRRPDVLELRFLESGLVGRTESSDEKFEEVKEDILTAAQGIRERNYTPKPDYHSCKYCAYTTICPVAVNV